MSHKQLKQKLVVPFVERYHEQIVEAAVAHQNKAVVPPK